MAAPGGTALDTVYGKVLVAVLQNIPGNEVYSQVQIAHTAWIMSSDDKYE